MCRVVRMRMRVGMRAIVVGRVCALGRKRSLGRGCRVPNVYVYAYDIFRESARERESERESGKCIRVRIIYLYI